MEAVAGRGEDPVLHHPLDGPGLGALNRAEPFIEVDPVFPLQVQTYEVAVGDHLAVVLDQRRFAD